MSPREALIARLADVRARLDHAKAQVESLEPEAEAIAAEIVVTPEYAPGSYRVWPNHVVRNGPTCLVFDNSTKMRWKNVNGDWLDRNGVEQGPVPWYSLTVPKGMAGPVELDITELAHRWHTGQNRGAFFTFATANSDNAWVQWCGTYGANPPQLIVSCAGRDDVSLVGDFAGFKTTKPTAANPPTNVTTGTVVLSDDGFRQLLHFNGLSAVDGDITRAVLRLHVIATDDVFPSRIDIFETDPPPLLLGGAGLQPVYGLAMEVGEENLSGHPDVIIAGDFREENWNGTPGKWEDNSLPAGKLFNAPSMSLAQYQRSKVVPDPDHPGRYWLDTCIAQGYLGGGEWRKTWHKSGPAETGYMPDPETYEPEIYSRCEIWLDPDTFWSRDFGFKFSPVGLDLRYGKGEPGGRWNGAAIYSYGSGQIASDGGRHWSEKHQQWLLEGHSIRGHLLGCPHPKYTAYPGAVAVGIAPSHLGPYDTLRDGGIYGTEHNLRIGTRGRDHCIPMGRWVTIEAHCKVNTIDMSVLDADGNGVARNDGVWEMWLDGVLVGGRYDLAWFRHPSMGIRGTWTMAYHGGTTPADHDIRFRLRNMVVARRYIGPARAIS